MVIVVFSTEIITFPIKSTYTGIALVKQ
jgi:hypothetical protein